MAWIVTANMHIRYDLAFTTAQVDSDRLDRAIGLLVCSEDNRRVGLVGGDPGWMVPYFQRQNHRQGRWRNSRFK